MIALDTNVLVRFLVEDDPSQRSGPEIGSSKSSIPTGRCFVSEIVLCELVWVLQRSYRVPRSEILEKVRKLVRSRHLFFSDVERVVTALDAYEVRQRRFLRLSDPRRFSVGRLRSCGDLRRGTASGRGLRRRLKRTLR